jgi:hypothetical protein
VRTPSEPIRSRAYQHWAREDGGRGVHPRVIDPHLRKISYASPRCSRRSSSKTVLVVEARMSSLISEARRALGVALDQLHDAKAAVPRITWLTSLARPRVRREESAAATRSQPVAVPGRRGVRVVARASESNTRPCGCLQIEFAPRTRLDVHIRRRRARRI